MPPANGPTVDPEAYGKRLAIVVPYRDRAEHLKAFLRHMHKYFDRDKLDRHIAVSINVIEQTAGKPFNRGKINNAGFKLVQNQCDYVCFHDVDYLPLWADYSWSPRPARVIWYGLTVGEDRDHFFGGVTLFDNDAFVRVNGFPNCYWGWGHEDAELSLRCGLRTGGFDKRDGTFTSLPHPHAGMDAAGALTAVGQRTRALFEERLNRVGALMEAEGLSDLGFRVVEEKAVSSAEHARVSVRHFVVDID